MTVTGTVVSASRVARRRRSGIRTLAEAPASDPRCAPWEYDDLKAIVAKVIEHAHNGNLSTGILCEIGSSDEHLYRRILVHYEPQRLRGPTRDRFVGNHLSVFKNEDDNDLDMRSFAVLETLRIP